MLKAHHRMYVCAFLLDCALMAGFTVVPFYIMRQLGGGARMVGTIAAIQSIAYALVSLVSSRYVTRAKNGLHWALAGVAGYAVLFCVAPLTGSPYPFALLSMAGVGCMGLVWPALWAWLGAEPDLKVRTRRISYYNVCWGAGLSLGPWVGQPLYHVDYRLPFLAVFVLAVVVWGLVASLPHEKRHYAPADTHTAEQHAAQGIYDRASERHLYSAWLANFVGWMLVGACRSVFATRIEELAGAGQLFLLGDGRFGLAPLRDAVFCFACIVFTINFSRVLVFLVLGRTQRWHHQFGFLATFQVGAAVAVLVLGMTQSFALMVLACAVVGMNCGMAFFAAVAYSLSNPARKHQRAAVNEAMVGGGGFLGSMGFGLLAGWYGTAMPFCWSPIVILLAIAAQWGLLGHGRRKHPPVAPEAETAQ